MADQDSPLDLTVQKAEAKTRNQDDVLDLSTKTNSSKTPRVKRLPVKTDHYEHDIKERYRLTLQGLQDGVWDTRTCSAPLKPLLARSLLVKEEVLSQKSRLFQKASSFPLTSLETVDALQSSDRFWKKPQLDGLVECKAARSHGGDVEEPSLLLENPGTFNESTNASQSKSPDIFTVSSRKAAGNTIPVNLKIPKVRSMDLSWNIRGNISGSYNYHSVITGAVQTDKSLSKRLRTILPKQSSRDGMGNLFVGAEVSENVGDADQPTFGPQYPTSGSPSDPTGSKQPRKKRGRYRQYDSEILEEAINVVMSGKMSVSKAQNIFGIPHSTLEYKVKERMGTLKNPPKKKINFIMREESIAAETETSSAPTAPAGTEPDEGL